MLRFFTNQGFYELWKCSHFAASCVTKRQVVSFLRVSSAAHHRLHIPARHFNTAIPVWKDILQPKTDNSEDIESLDVDKWKSVMRAQASQEKQVSDKEEACDNENLKEPGGDLKDSSSLEATRELVAMWQQAGKCVPQKLTEEQVQIVAGLTTKSSRKKYLKFLALKERVKLADKEKQQKRAAEREAYVEQRGTFALENTFFLRFWDSTQDRYLAWRSAQAMLYGQPLLFDMGHESHMAKREIENTVNQLLEVEGWNRRATEPYHLHYCNLQTDGTLHKELLRRYGAEFWNRMLITTSDKQHIDLFPREQLVYLTPDSPNVLHTYDHSKVYIIGALVDRSLKTGLTLACAKRLNLATARLPLDQFLHWEIGGKHLSLDQMIRIMLTMKETGKWEEALKFVPKRKHDGFHQQRTREEFTNNRFKGVKNVGQRQNGERPFKIWKNKS